MGIGKIGIGKRGGLGRGGLGRGGLGMKSGCGMDEGRENRAGSIKHERRERGDV